MIGFLNAILANPVTLNLFQGPSGRMRHAGGVKTALPGLRASINAVWVEKWTLKQVQGDEKIGSWENTLGVEFVR